MIDQRRVRILKNAENASGPIVYIMARDQRIADNWALLFAQDLAIKQKQSLIVVCPLAVDYPNISERQSIFMNQGLLQVENCLSAKNIAFIVSSNSAASNLLSLINKIKVGVLVTDFNPLKESRRWKSELAKKINIRFYEVDAHNIVPCWETSEKREYAAYTIRAKINKKLDEFLCPFPNLAKHPFVSKGMMIPGGWSGLDRIKGNFPTENKTGMFVSGESAARKQLQDFLKLGLSQYNDLRNNPAESGQSNLSPYLHFGQISAQRIALEVMCYDANIQSQEAFLEELIVRRELSDNFCYYNNNYDSFDGFPDWAQKTLNTHRLDPRPYIYRGNELEEAATHDELWNAAQIEMVITGKMHGYMRMYWAKKILEWSISPEEALANAIYLNNKYELDGHDPNGYGGIAWSIGGVHDRAWSEREIFGKVRYMNYNGCKRKFLVSDYIKYVSSLKSEVSV